MSEPADPTAAVEQGGMSAATEADPTRSAVEQELRAAGFENAAAEATLILEKATRDGDAHRALELARQRTRGAPLGYLLGVVRFMGIELLAGPGALSPREETELLGARALRLLGGLSPSGAGLLAIDMCCGAGNLACGLGAALPGLRLLASDLTEGCVSLARRNVFRLHLEPRVSVEQGDLFAPFAGRGLEGTVQAVVCNPPYISTGRLEKDRAGLLRHEPREAFDGGPYGLSIQQRVIRDAAPFLAPGGFLLMELGLGQERQLDALFKRTRKYEEVEWVTDASGAPRVAAARRRGV